VCKTFKKVCNLFQSRPLYFINLNKNDMKIRQNFIRATACFLISTGLLQSFSVAQKSAKLTDPEIASIAVTANQVDIDYAKIAEQKSKDPEVIKFAKTMAKDHQSVINQALDLVKELGVTPKDNPTSKSLKAGEVKTKKLLHLKSGKAFDKAYINNEVAYHKEVIKEVENTLIPDAQNAELKGLLQNVLPVLKAHLSHAEMVQKEVAK
jgi:putative membrane protein